MPSNGNAELENLPEAGSPPKKRIKSSDSLVGIANKYIEQDENAAYLRARAHAAPDETTWQEMTSEQIEEIIAAQEPQEAAGQPA